MNTLALAETCAASLETVTGLLAGIRDEIVDLVLARKHNVTLAIGLGSLFLRSNGTVEFKSAGSAAAVSTEEFDRLPEDYDRFSNSVMARTHTSGFSHRKQSENVGSRHSTAERSLNFMQQRQASQGRCDVQSQGGKSTQNSTINKYFSTPAMNTEGGQGNSAQNLEPVKKNNLVFLNSFLRN